MNPYSSLCDDFGMTVNLASKMELPTGRETVLGFFDAVKKRFPRMTDFEKRGETEFALEEERDGGNYRFVTLDGRRLTMGAVNPPTLEAADELANTILEMAPYHEGISPLETDYLDVQYYFDLDYKGNHDEITVEALAGDGPFDGFGKVGTSGILNYQPSMMVALEDSGQLQARLSIETRTTPYHVRTHNYPELPISTYLTIRQFWHKQPYANYMESYKAQRERLDELVNDWLLPQVVQPLQRAIAAKS